MWRPLLLLVIGCSSTSPKVEVEQAGPYEVGTTRYTLDGDRTLTVQAWFPTEAAAESFAVEGFEDEPNRATYAGLLDGEDCASQTARAAVDAEPAAGTWPLVVSSHCHNCTRFSTFTVSERLASWGFVVVAVDHTDNTLWDYLDDTDVPLDADFLPTRAADVRASLDDALVRFDVDADAIGVMGHSFGSVTAGRVAQDDARVASAFGLSAPMDNPLLQGVEIEALELPLGFLIAFQDSSITAIGNDLIRDNFASAPGEAWMIEEADAGHWSWSDLAGVSDIFENGCGDVPLDPVEGRGLAASYATAFFLATLTGDAGARAYLDSVGEFHPVR